MIHYLNHRIIQYKLITTLLRRKQSTIRQNKMLTNQTQKIAQKILLIKHNLKNSGTKEIGIFLYLFQL